MNNNQNNIILNGLNTLANITQLESYKLLLKDANNNDIMRHLEKQDRVLDEQTQVYLKTIVEQNNEIIKLLKERRNTNE
jgi:hypothetical protein